MWRVFPEQNEHHLIATSAADKGLCRALTWGRISQICNGLQRECLEWDHAGGGQWDWSSVPAQVNIVLSVVLLHSGISLSVFYQVGLVACARVILSCHRWSLLIYPASWKLQGTVLFLVTYFKILILQVLQVLKFSHSSGPLQAHAR